MYSRPARLARLRGACAQDCLPLFSEERRDIAGQRCLFRGEDDVEFAAAHLPAVQRTSCGIRRHLLQGFIACRRQIMPRSVLQHQAAAEPAGQVFPDRDR